MFCRSIARSVNHAVMMLEQCNGRCDSAPEGMRKWARSTWFWPCGIIVKLRMLKFCQQQSERSPPEVCIDDVSRSWRHTHSRRRPVLLPRSAFFGLAECVCRRRVSFQECPAPRARHCRTAFTPGHAVLAQAMRPPCKFAIFH